MVESTQTLPNVLVLGTLGIGKSTIGNVLANYEAFKTSSSP